MAMLKGDKKQNLIRTCIHTQEWKRGKFDFSDRTDTPIFPFPQISALLVLGISDSGLSDS